jgi:hypothetical protein
VPEPHPERTENPIARQIAASVPNRALLRFCQITHGMKSIASVAAILKLPLWVRLTASNLDGTVVRAAVATLVEMVIVAVAAAVVGVTLAGEKLQEVYAGRPEHLSEVDAEKPPVGVMLTTLVVELPGVTVALEGESETVKSGGCETTIDSAVETDDPLLPSPG